MELTTHHQYGSYENGVLTTRLKSWGEFYNVIDSITDYQFYIWRGHRCDNWALESKFDRILREKNKHSQRDILLSNHLYKFKRATRGRRGPHPPELKEENDWLAIGQHHGLVTPLLDWTRSPFVAAYFAFIEQKEPQTNYRVVYGLSADILRWGPAVPGQETPKEKFVEVINVQSDENSRLINQGGLFTVMLRGEGDIKTLIKKCYNKRPNEDRIILFELLIPNSERETCLKALNRMNINHLTLFPDLYGASKFCNMSFEVEKY